MKPKPRQRCEWGARTVRWLACSALLITAVACDAQQTAPLAASITIRDQQVQLEIARSETEKAKGLGDRDSLAWGQGMLFEYSAPGFPRFWMKDMRFDIDIVWIREFRIVDISHRVKHFPEGPGPTIQPRELADTVLEVPAGFAQAHRWRLGDRVTLSGVAPGVPSSAP